MKEYFDIDKNPAGCRCCYKTPDGFDNIILTGDGSNINTLRFDRQNTYHESFGINELPVFYDAVQWLEQYFSGRKPEPFPYIKLNGCTGFRRTVIDLLAEVPYGQTVSYGELAIRASQFTGTVVSPRAVAAVMSWNPVLIMYPCHRVISSRGTLCGYSGGLENKQALLELESGNSLFSLSTEF